MYAAGRLRQVAGTARHGTRMRKVGDDRSKGGRLLYMGRWVTTGCTVKEGRPIQKTEEGGVKEQQQQQKIKVKYYIYVRTILECIQSIVD